MGCAGEGKAVGSPWKMSGGAVVVLGDQSASSDTDDKRGAPLRPRAYTTGLISQLQSILAAGGPDSDSATDTAPTYVHAVAARCPVGPPMCRGVNLAVWLRVLQPSV